MYYEDNEQDENDQKPYEIEGSDTSRLKPVMSGSSEYISASERNEGFEDKSSYHSDYYDVNDKQFCGISPDYEHSSSSNSSDKKSNRKNILMILGLILLVAAVSALTCFIFMKVAGNGFGGYKINQETSSVEGTSVDAAGTDVLTTPQIVKAVIPTVVEVNVEKYNGSGSGSGIVFSSDGYIVTNQHVVNGAETITVKMSDGHEYQATIVGEDEQTDLAVIKVQAKGLTPAVIGTSDNLAQGETVLVIGNPLGETLSGSVSQGIVSALGREIEVEGRTMHYIQTDAAINPGNSGGALVNLSGQVVGIPSAKISSSQLSSAQTEGLGFAIPIDEAVPVIEDLINQGYVSGRPLIGISGETITAQIAMIYNIPEGIYVRYIDPKSGAAKAGIQQGDIIVAADGTDTASMEALNSVRDKHKAGETIELKVYRNGETRTVKVVLGEQKVTESK